MVERRFPILVIFLNLESSEDVGSCVFQFLVVLIDQIWEFYFVTLDLQWATELEVSGNVCEQIVHEKFQLVCISVNGGTSCCGLCCQS